MASVSIDYRPPGETIRQFHLSNSYGRILIGPFGSGKTKSVLFEVWRRAIMQAPHDKRRKTRALIARTTYPELVGSTIPDWRDMFNSQFGNFTQSPIPRHEIRVHYTDPLTGKRDGTVVELDVMFLAFDSGEAAESLRSTEFSFAVLNEMKQFEKPVLDMITSRLRYQPLGGGTPSFIGYWGDSNAPDVDHWLYKMCEEDRPENVAVFKQPPAVAKDDKGKWRVLKEAENVHNMRKAFPPDGTGYYRNIMAGKNEDWIRVNLANEYGFVMDGKPVYPTYRDTVHCAGHMLEPIPGLPIFLGQDYGLQPATLFVQRTARGQIRIIDELVTEDMGLRRHAMILAGRLAEWYPGFKVSGWGDPAGGTRSQTDETTCFEIMKDVTGIDIQPAPDAYDSVLRLEAVRGCLDRMIDGAPGLIVSPAAKTTRKGFAGGYRFKRLKVAGEERYHDVPEKNSSSHPHDALQAVILGLGEGASVIGRQEREMNATNAPAECDGAYEVLTA